MAADRSLEWRSGLGRRAARARSECNRPSFRRPLRKSTSSRASKVDHRPMLAGAEIIHMGQEDAELYTLFKGWAFRHQTLPDGRRQILNFLLPGDLVGFQASLMTAAQHSVEALTNIEVCVFSRRKAWSIFAQMPEVAYQLAWLGARRRVSSMTI